MLTSGVRTGQSNPQTAAGRIDLTLAIVIVSWNVKPLLRDCLNSVLTGLAEDDLSGQVWVVDNGSTDGSPAMVRAEFPGVRLIVAETNPGFAGGNNRALQAMGFPQSRPDQPAYVLLLNPDTLLKPRALRALVDLMSGRPEVGIAGANLVFADGAFQHGAFHFPGLWQLAIELFPLPGRLYESALNGRYPRRRYDGQAPFAIDHPLGAAMLVRAEAIRAVGLLDEGYRMYVEEVDWAWRIKRAGWQAYCVPTAKIVHLGGQSTGQVQTESFLNLWRSRYRFYRRSYPGWKLALARRLVERGMARKMNNHPEMAATFRQVQAIWQGQDR